MSDSFGQLQTHLHSHNMLQHWKDKEWQTLSTESILKSDTAFDEELFSLARPKISHDQSKVEDEDNDILTVRKAMQGMDKAEDKIKWNDKGYQRILMLAVGNYPHGKVGGDSVGENMGSLTLR